MTFRNDDFSQVRDWDNENFVHPWEGLDSIGKNQRTFAETADGIYVTTETGGKLIDGPGGMW